jgi:hypothetical protein
LLHIYLPSGINKRKYINAKIKTKRNSSLLGSESKSSITPINDQIIIIITEIAGVKNSKKKKGFRLAHFFGESLYMRYKKKIAQKEKIKGISTFAALSSNIHISRKKDAQKPSGSSNPKMKIPSSNKANAEGINFFTIQLLF